MSAGGGEAVAAGGTGRRETVMDMPPRGFCVGPSGHRLVKCKPDRQLTLPEIAAILAICLLAVSPSALGHPELDPVHKGFVFAGLLPVILTTRVEKHTTWGVMLQLAAYAISGWTLSTLSSSVQAIGTLSFGLLLVGRRWRAPYAILAAVSVVPVLSVLLGILLQVAGITVAVRREFTGAFRLAGAAIPAHLALLAFCGLFASSAAIASLLGPPAAAPTRQAPRRLVRLWVGLLVADWLILALTGTRGSGVLASIAVICVGVVASRNRLLKRRLKFTLSLVAVFVVLIALPTYVERTSVSSMDSGLNLSGRQSMWTEFYGSGLDHAVSGSGPGSVTEVANGLALYSSSGFRIAPIVPHNEYIRLFVDLGVLGTILWLAGLAVALGPSVRSRSPGLAPIAGLWVAALLLLAMVDNAFSTPQMNPLFFVTLSAMMCLGREASHRPLLRGGWSLGRGSMG